VAALVVGDPSHIDRGYKEEPNMNFKMLSTVFVSIFLAELGDKTQIATLILASQEGLSRVAVFIGASCALVLACLLAVLIGSQFSRFVSPQVLKIAAGVGFIVLGAWILITAKA
jgi:putative Ca2+/H+ antiporter (TMEM165/GDT1 family)